MKGLIFLFISLVYSQIWVGESIYDLHFSSSDEFGTNMKVFGDWAIISRDLDQPVSIFKRNQGIWNYLANINPPETTQQTGFSSSVSVNLPLRAKKDFVHKFF